MNMNQETIVRCLQQRASIDEQQKLEQWLNEKPSHQSYFDQIESVWQSAECVPSELNFDSGKAWDCILSKISISAEGSGKGSTKGSRESSTESVVVPLWSQSWIRVAASVVLAIGVGLGVYFQLDTSPADSIAITETTGAGSVQEVQLPDGSLVTLMPFSSVSYTSDFASKRELTLTGGAFFEIKKANGQPFAVSTKQIEVAVLGTEFLVKESKNRTEVFVEGGSVSISSKTTAEAEVLTSDEGAYLDSSSGLIKPFAASDNILSWKSGVLEFNNVQLTKVLEDIGKHYNVSIQLKNSNIGKCHLTSRFDNKSIDEVLQVLELVLNIEISSDNANEYLISGKGC